MSNRHLIRGCMAAFLALGALSMAPAHAGLFGESDEEKAARQHEQDQDAAIKDLTQRVRDLEQSLSRATGDNENLSHQVQVLNDKLERQRKDFEYRLCTIAGQQLGAGQGDDQSGSSLPCGGGSGSGASMTYNAPPPPANAAAQSNVVRLAPPPGVLGTLPAGRNAAPAPTGNPQTRVQFDAALNLLAKARYDDARAAFRTFADSNPDDELTPQAVYWIGDIAYVQKDYAGAAHTFVEQLKKYPTSSRAPDSMLKLGQSLIALGQTKQGCNALGTIASQYPSAPKTILAQAAAAHKASCK
ncbi:MAG TPA: tol-pal system protein YbgF [Rhizomicrobium sp.]|nr:tol-pal system protein YbgF [Rhizomicrobium sp.]